MALPKRVKVGGGFFEGFQLSVLFASGSYILHMSTEVNRVINGIQFVASESGAADYIHIGVYENTSGGAALVTPIATNIFHPGPGVPMAFNIPALEHVRAGQDLRFVYVNSGSIAGNVNVYLECLK